MAACSAAVWRGGILASRFEPMERGHAERIAPMVDYVMREAALPFAEIDRIAVTTGPGTFTGQRIGLAMARGLGLALDKPVIGVTTLETIASVQQGNGAPIVVVCDARRDEYYFAVYSERLEPLHDLALLSLGSIVERVPSGRVYVIGSAADTFIMADRRDRFVRIRDDLPKASNLAALAAIRAASNRMPEPLYLRAPDARPQAGRVADPIRRAGPNEAASISSLHRACFEPAWDEAAISALMAAPGTSAWLAEAQGEANGFVLARRAADEVEILSLGTKPSARRRGFARKLVGALAGAHADASAIFIEVAADNGAALALYESCGFIEAGRRNAYYARVDGTRQDAIIMRKDLNR